MSDKMPLSEIRRILERGEWWDNVRDVSPDEPCPWLDELNGAIEAALDRLTEYKTAEKDGRLVRLPVQVGQTVYVIVNLPINIIGISPYLSEETVCDVSFRNSRALGCEWALYTDNYHSSYGGGDIGKTVFLNRAEAEAALQELRDALWAND